MNSNQTKTLVILILAIALGGSIFYICSLRDTISSHEKNLVEHCQNAGASFFKMDSDKRSDSIKYTMARKMHNDYKKYFVLKTDSGDTLEGFRIDLSRMKDLLDRNPKELYIGFAVKESNISETDPSKKLYTLLVAGIDSSNNLITSNIKGSRNYKKPIVYDYCDPCPSYCTTIKFSDF